MYFHTSNPMKDKPVRLPQGSLLLTPGKETGLKRWRDLPNSHSLRASLPGFLTSHACPFHWIRAAIPPCLLFQAKYSFSYSLHSSTADPLPPLSPTCHYISVKNNRTPFQREESLLLEKSSTASDIGHGFSLCGIPNGHILGPGQVPRPQYFLFREVFHLGSHRILVSL